jgi:regulator of replication initiation timing
MAFYKATDTSENWYDVGTTQLTTYSNLTRTDVRSGGEQFYNEEFHICNLHQVVLGWSDGRGM